MVPAIGISVPIGFGLSRNDALGVAVDADCDFLEFVADGPYAPENLPDDFADRAASRGLDIAVHLPFAVPVHAGFDAQSEGVLRTHERVLDWAGDVGAVAAVVHPSSAAWTLARGEEAVIEGILDGVRRLDSYAADRGVDLCVENVMDGPFTLDGLDRLLDATDASVTLDTGHARTTGSDLDDQLAFVRAYRDRLGHVHLNDTRGADDEHLPLGAGDYDFPALLDALDDWDGRLCIEAVVGDATYLVESVDRLRAMC